MAAKTTLVRFTSTNSGDFSVVSADGAQNAHRKLLNHLEGGANGAQTIRGFTISDSAVQGSLTITLASVAAGTVLLINGVPFTAKGSAATAGNNEFDISGGTDTLDAAALAAAINASTSAGITGVVTATSENAVVTLTSVAYGRAANAITVQPLGVVATGTVTCAGVDDADTVSINGVTLTAKTTVADATVEFAVGATDAATATNLAALINSTATDSLVTKHVRALARSAVVHLFARYGGIAGNSITLASSDGTDLAVSGARLTGGTMAQYEGVQASGTITITGADAGNYTALVNGVTTGNIAGTNGDDDQTAEDIAAALQVSTNALVSGQVTVSVSANVITIAAVRGGHAGNAITISTTGTGSVASGARLTGGATPTAFVLAGGTATALGSGAQMSSGSNSSDVSFTF